VLFFFIFSKSLSQDNPLNMDKMVFNGKSWESDLMVFNPQESQHGDKTCLMDLKVFNDV